MEYEFSIPVARDDLLNRSGVSQYVVDEVLSLRELPGAIQGKEVDKWKLKEKTTTKTKLCNTHLHDLSNIFLIYIL